MKGRSNRAPGVPPAAGAARRGGAAAALLVLALLLSSCAKWNSHETAGSDGPGRQKVGIDMQGSNFAPRQITARPGGTLVIMLHNKDVVTHNFTIENMPVNVDVPGNKSRTVEITLPDTSVNLRFACRFMRQQNMEGNIVVGTPTETTVGKY